MHGLEDTMDLVQSESCNEDNAVGDKREQPVTASEIFPRRVVKISAQAILEEVLQKTGIIKVRREPMKFIDEKFRTNFMLDFTSLATDGEQHKGYIFGRAADNEEEANEKAAVDAFEYLRKKANVFVEDSNYHPMQALKEKVNDLECSMNSLLQAFYSLKERQTKMQRRHDVIVNIFKDVLKKFKSQLQISFVEVEYPAIGLVVEQAAYAGEERPEGVMQRLGLELVTATNKACELGLRDV